VQEENRVNAGGKQSRCRRKTEWVQEENRVYNLLTVLMTVGVGVDVIVD
jgi:hypothetical protein